MHFENFHNKKRPKIDDSPSRFVLDLHSISKKQEEAKAPTHKKALRGCLSVLNKKEKKQTPTPNKDGIYYTRGSEITPGEVAQDFNSYKKTFFSSREKKERKEEERFYKKLYEAYEKDLERLAFFPLIKFVAKITYSIYLVIHRIIHKIFWSFAFLYKFAGLLFISIFNPKKAAKLAQNHFTKVISKIAEQDLEDGYYLDEEEILQEIHEEKDESSNSEQVEEPEELFIFDEEHEGESRASGIAELITKGPVKKLKLKPILVFAFVLLVLVVPIKSYTFLKSMDGLKGRVLGVSEAAFSGMKNATKQAAGFNFDAAGKDFDTATYNFLTAQEEIKEVSGILKAIAVVIPNKNIRLASHAEKVLESAALSAEIGTYMTKAFSSLSEDEDEKNISNILESFYINGQEISTRAHKLRENIKSIDPKIIPEKYKEQFISLQEKAVIIDGSMSEFVDILEKMKIFLGMDYDKRYLLVFQNNTELRASGGFIGSYALIDFRNGKIKNLEVPGGGSYDTEAGLYDMLAAPSALHLVNPLWHFWDANWWPDWERTAKKLMWFYEKSDGPSVDGVISFTPNVIEGLLRVVGSVDMTEDYGVVIDSENFWEVVQTFSEQKQDVTLKPKKIIGDMLNKIIADLPGKINKESLIELTKVTEQNLSEKHILFYFNDPILQSKVIDYDWGGKIKQTDSNYLMVVNTNIAGGKSDKLVKESIEHNAVLESDGTITNTLSITRAHTGVKRAAFTGVRNVDWMRIYVPEGSKLISASGFERPDEIYFEYPKEDWKKDPYLELTENQATTDIQSGTKIYNEEGKTVFANWSQVDPGKSITVTLKYKLPFKLSKPAKTNLTAKVKDYLGIRNKDTVPYTLIVQKQPGSQGSDFSSEFNLAPNYKSIWTYPEDLTIFLNKWKISDTLKEDKYWATLLEIQ